MRHGYTNDTTGDGRVVRKSYAGPDAEQRREREATALRSLYGVLPVPRVVEAGDVLVTEYVDGQHGQDLIDRGLAAAVLHTCGCTLTDLHRTGTTHGDYGPNNLLFDETGTTVRAIVDWEWAGTVEPITDLVWCEWIVRMHHPDHVSALGSLFDGYGNRPPWSSRQRAMIDRCVELRDFVEQWDPGGAGVRLWDERTDQVRDWREIP
jgi:aminoglycoside phosphotransferase (APT) family kinase protein